MHLNEILDFLKQIDAPCGEIDAFSSYSSHFHSRINFLSMGTMALIFVKYNVQLGLSQVSLADQQNRNCNSINFCSVAPNPVTLCFVTF